MLFPPCTLLTVKVSSSHGSKEDISLREVLQLAAKRHNGELTTDDVQQFKLKQMGERVVHKAADGTENGSDTSKSRSCRRIFSEEYSTMG